MSECWPRKTMSRHFIRTRREPEKFHVRPAMPASEECYGMYDELDRWYGEERHAHADSSRNSFDFWGLTLSGSVSVGDIARFYGLNIPHSECGMTLAVYLKRMGNGGLHPGYRASVGKADFVVLETENGTARKIGLAMRPAREHKPWLHRARRRVA
jgi:hypothetical protein